MKKPYLWILAVLVFVTSVSSQKPTPTVSPTPPENENDVVKISTTLIQVDVTVTDKNGKIVTDLKPQDFEIFENGKKQDITNFSFVSNVADVNAEVKPAPVAGNADRIDGVPVPLPPVKMKSEQVRRTIALVIDDLGIAFENMIRVRAALRRFVDEQMQPTDLVAIIRTGSGIGALQQFTSDKNQLYSAIEKIRWNPQGRSGISTFAPIDSSTSQTDDTTESTDEEVTDTSNAAATFQEDIFSVGTLGAVNFVIKGMKELPGRKAVILFSDGFTICSFDGSDSDTNRCDKMFNAVKQLTDFANRSSVTIYSLDSKGLAYTDPTAADSLGTSTQTMADAIGSRSQQNMEMQEGLAFLAKETGGRTYFNSNDMVGSVKSALDDQKGFYLVAYQPDSETFDPKTRRFNKLEVKLKRPGMNVRYRSGFFGIAEKDVKPPVQTPIQQMVSALSSPFSSNGINISLNTFFGADKQKAGFMQSFVHIDAKDIKFTDDPNGEKKAAIEIIAISFGDNGVPIDQIAKNYSLAIKPEDFQKIQKEGFVYNFSFPIKVAGAYQMRVAVRDTATSKIGSANQFIEVPDLKKGKLTLSGIVLQNVSLAQWRSLSAKLPLPTTAEDQRRNPMADTSLRRFAAGTVLRYAVDVYNSKPGKFKSRQLVSQVRVFRDGKLAFNRAPEPVKVDGRDDSSIIHLHGAFGLGKDMTKGYYVLQIIVSDALAKGKSKLATQWIQFEVE